MKLTRRTFLKATGVTGAGVALATQLKGPEAVLEALAPKVAPAPGEKYVANVCLQCPAGCGILVRVVDGRAVKIEGNPLHPINEGKLCPKGQAGLGFLYDPDRIKGPLKRVGERGEGKWERITWAEAISLMTARLKEMRDRGDAHRLVFLSGRNRGLTGGFIGRFLKAYGSPNDVGHSSICEDGSPMGHYLTQGWKGYAGYDWDNTNYALVFGAGFIEAWRPTTRLLRAFGHMRRERPVRAKIVVVDTRFSISAAKADEWLAIKPGTDGALALGMAHVIVREGLYDKEFVEKLTFGFDDWADEKGQRHLGFKQLVLQDYPPEKVAEITGIPAETIVRIAREFAATRPAIAAGARGKSMQTNGVYNSMAIHALNALVGSIDRLGGVTNQMGSPLKGDPPVVQDEISKKGASQPRIDWAGTKRFPLAGKVYQNIPEYATGQGPYTAQALFMHYTNPMFSTPDVKRWEATFKQIPFIVDFTPFMSESAEYADLILPDDTYLERWQDDGIYPSLGYPVLGIRQPVVDRLYDTVDTATALAKIAQAMGGTMAQSFPWRDAKEYIQFKVRGIFEARKGTIVASTFEEWWDRFTKDGVWADPTAYKFEQWGRTFTNKQKKYEFFSLQLQSTFEKLKMTEKDIAALKITATGDRVFLPHHEPPRFPGDPKEYPLILNTYKMMSHAEGRGANVPYLQEIGSPLVDVKWDSWVEINPGTAERLGISDGDLVWVESPVGKVKTRAKVYPGAQPDVVSFPFDQGHRAYGRWAKNRGANPNWALVNEIDHLGGLAAFFSTRVKVYRA
ncbi:MAG: molybdopterin-dependent oxidoreductase [Chloroflexi bacterium]|nr:molybdopterin-dependent oxidoreductase [Chloroflexota bacterium]